MYVWLTSYWRELTYFISTSTPLTRIPVLFILCRAAGPAQQQLHSGASSYSDVAVLPDGTLLCLYEGGKVERREWLRLARFSLDWLDAGRPPDAAVPSDADAQAVSA